MADTEIERLRDHAEQMAGRAPAADRVLWQQIADETGAFLTARGGPPPGVEDEPGLF